MNTSYVDYRINMNNIEHHTTLFKYKNIHIYLAKWRKYQIVCVKQIENDDKVDNELHILSKCIHPKIVQFLGTGKTDIHTYMLFEYMENGNLEEYISKVKLNAMQKYQLMLDICIGVHYLHNRKPEIVLHRDLKPGNILVNTHGEAKISDFGISKLINTEMCNVFTGHTGETGTYIWMSPEVLKHEEYNYKADIYCLGLILYFIWTEKKPFQDYNMNTIQLMFAKFQNKLDIIIDDNEDMNDLVNYCCAYDKDKRPNAEYVIEILSSFISRDYQKTCTHKQKMSKDKVM